MIRSVEKYHKKIAFHETDYTDSQADKNRIGEKLQIWNGLMVYLQISAFGCIHPTNHKNIKSCDILSL